MSKLFKIFLISFLTFFVTETSFAQKKKGENYHENQTPFGKKHREKKNQSKALSKRGGLFKKKYSAGNADAFAGNSVRGRKGFLSKIFSGGSSSSKNASLRKTRPGKTQNKEQSKLFKRNRTKTKNNNSGFLHRQNKDRSAKRKRGNSVFSKKKR